jgi:Alkylmercury lyase
VTVRIERGTLLDKDYVIHFPVPMAKAWDNVVYTCSMMLLFAAEAEVENWCAKRRIAKGDVRPIEQIWGFAREWYGRHLDPDWHKWTADEAAAMFRRHGLDGPIWQIPVSKSRF